MVTTRNQLQIGQQNGRLIGPSFSTTVQPALASWQAIAKPWDTEAGRPADLLKLVNINAAVLGTGSLAEGDAPLWVTGHQAWLWHPGILAKDLVSAAAAKRFGGDELHLVVDHDIHDALHMQLPMQTGNRLSLHELTLSPTRVDIPAACQPAVDMTAALNQLRKTRDTLGNQCVARLDALDAGIEAIASNISLPAFETLGQQMAALTAVMLRPWVRRNGHDDGDSDQASLPMLLTSQLCQLQGFDQIVHAMLHDATSCMTAYNRAVLSQPQAGIGPLAMDRQFIELPLWLLTWQGRRQAVYADITDTTPILVTADGSPIKTNDADATLKDMHQPRLAPRAMLLTAIMRRFYATAFIHGTGGGVYDQVTEAWWSSWRGGGVYGKLAPMTVATADLRLPFELPSATRHEVLLLQQKVHHLKHNLNLETDLPAQAKLLAQAKADLLTHMHDDSDKWRKQAVFKQIHSINKQLAALMPQVLADADEALAEAKMGLRNHGLTMKRDWPFVIYPREALAHLAQAIGGGAR